MSDATQIRVPATQLLFARFMRATPGLWTALGNLETRTLGRELEQVRIQAPIYVTGLARAGTTIVTELLNCHPDVTSHHYSDFPPVWTPYWWNSLRAQLPLPASQPQERAHMDRIQITPDSPEAVEELLWMRFFPDSHDSTQNNVLGAQTDNAAFERFYRAHIRKLLHARSTKRYLAKGNYNLTRLAYLQMLFPDARFVVVVRDPVWHIASLMKQDRLFCELHKRDPRFTDYLKLLGHYEFGVHKEAINVGDAARTHEIHESWGTDKAVRGWTLYWRSLYRFVLEQIQNNEALASACLIVRYEDLCADPVGEVQRLLEHCRLDPVSCGESLDTLVQSISPPRYYQPEFTDAQRREINEVAGEVLAQLDSNWKVSSS